MNLPTTDSISSGLPYIDGRKEFVDKINSAFDAVHNQVLKFESWQDNPTSDDKTFQEWLKGNKSATLDTLEEVRAPDKERYRILRERGVDFIRCRPVKFPLDPYVEWEFAHYKFNEDNGERIYLCNLISAEEIFRKYARHDFMVFDARIALIYDYDQSNSLQGGWIVDKLDHIAELMKLFVFIKSQSQPFSRMTK